MKILTHNPTFFIDNIVTLANPNTIFNLLNINDEMRTFWLSNRDDIVEWYTDVIHIDVCWDYEIIIYQSGKKLERRMEYHPCSKVISKTEMLENDMLHGISRTFDINGNITSENRYNRGLLLE